MEALMQTEFSRAGSVAGSSGFTALRDEPHDDDAGHAGVGSGSASGTIGIASMCDRMRACFVDGPLPSSQTLQQPARSTTPSPRDARSLVQTLDKTVVLPISAAKENWDLGIMLLILYCGISVPVRVCFAAEAEGALFVFEAGMSLFFLADLGLTFNTAYYEDGLWVTDRLLIARRYLTGWFWIDGPSSIPVELIELSLEMGPEDAAHLRVLRVLRLFRLIRLLRLLKVDQYIAKIEEMWDVDLRALQLVTLVAKLLFFAHLLGCFWFYVITALEGDREDTWIHVYDDGSAVDGPVSRQYLFSVYWALTTLTTVGYGDITPNTDTERMMAIIALILGSLIFAYMLGEVGALIATMDYQASLVTEKMGSVKEYTRWRSLPRELAVRVHKYYEHYYTKQPVFDEQLILSGLSPSLHSEVVRSILRDTVGKLPLFSKMISPEFQLAIFPKLKPLSFSRGQTIFEKGEASQDLLFVLNGEVDVLNRNDEHFMKISPNECAMIDNKTGATLVSLSSTAGGCFGQSVLVGKRREAKHVAYTSCEVWSIAKEDMRELFRTYPKAARLVCQQVLKDYVRFDRLRLLSVRMGIALEIDRKKRTLLRCALQWKEHTAIKLMEHDNLYHVINEADGLDTRVSVLDGVKGASMAGATAAAGSPSSASAAPAVAIMKAGKGAVGAADAAKLFDMMVALTAKVDKLLEEKEQAAKPMGMPGWRSHRTSVAA